MLPIFVGNPKYVLQNLTTGVIALAPVVVSATSASTNDKMTTRLFKRLIFHKKSREVKEGYEQHSTPAKPRKDVHNEENSDLKDEMLPSGCGLTESLDDPINNLKLTYESDKR